MMQPGSTFGHYEIVSELGHGGMGEVYRARDIKLGREVAIKTLPHEFAQDADRLARFEREAKLLASLNHPNIAAIYGLEEHQGARFLVLELVEGLTLAEGLKNGAIPVAESLKLASQIAEALEAAHAKGVVHRDLKPANIKVTPDGQVKVLDFGLAKAFTSDQSDVNLSNSPTLSMGATQAGIVLGTAAYMSPEQARGLPADHRADVFSFGCVLYEMLTGRTAFRGELTTEILASVINQEPDYSALGQDLHPKIRELLRRCFEKQPRDRWQAIGDVRIEMEAVLRDPHGLAFQRAATPTRTLMASTLPWVLVGVLGAVVASLVFVLWNSGAAPSGPVHLSVVVPGDERVFPGGIAAISDDGNQLAYVSLTGGMPQLCIRELDTANTQCVSGYGDIRNPFFAPAGDRIGFVADGVLRMFDLNSTVTTTVSERAGLGATWHPDGARIVFNPVYDEGLWIVPATGGEPERLTTVDGQRELGHWWPQVLSDGNRVIFTRYASPMVDAEIALLELDSRQVTTLMEGAVFGRYIEATGHLLFVRSDTLMAVPYDLVAGNATGPERPVQEDVSFNYGNANAAYAVSPSGTLAYIPSADSRELVWVSMDGTEEPASRRRDSYWNPSLSPDGRRIAYELDRERPEVWLHDVERDSYELFSSGETARLDPLWAPGGENIVFQIERRFWDLERRSTTDGTEELLFESGGDKFPTSFSPDGRSLVYSETKPANGDDIWVLSMDEGRATVFQETPFAEILAVVAPDGNWIAYQSDRDGRPEIYIQPFPDGGLERKVSVEGGTDPQWSRNGRTLFFRSESMMAVDFDAGFQPRLPHPLFQDIYEGPRGRRNGYDIGPNGRFLMVKTPPELVPRQINVVLGWFDELRQLSPAP